MVVSHAVLRFFIFVFIETLETVKMNTIKPANSACKVPGIYRSHLKCGGCVRHPPPELPPFYCSSGTFVSRKSFDGIILYLFSIHCNFAPGF